MTTQKPSRNVSNQDIALYAAHAVILVPLLVLVGPSFISAKSTALSVIGFLIYPLTAWFIYAVSIPLFNRTKENVKS